MDSSDLALSWLMAHRDERLEVTYEYEPALNCIKFKMRKGSNFVSRLVYVEEVMDSFVFVRIPAILENMYQELTKEDN